MNNSILEALSNNGFKTIDYVAWDFSCPAVKTVKKKIQKTTSWQVTP